ncbi:hypothetical protein ScPMuIL_014929, partial [Solemya velum]
CLENLDIIAARCLVQVVKGEAVLRVCNPTDHAVRVRAKHVLGSVDRVDRDSIISMENDNTTPLNTITPSESQKPNKRTAPVNFDLSQSDLNQEQKQKLLILLDKYREVFAVNLAELGKSKMMAHKIDTGDAPPVRVPFYHQPPKIQKEINQTVEELLKHDIIEESNSSYHSPVLLVRKQGDSNERRFVVDYRKLNQITKPVFHPLPRLECVFDTIGENKPTMFSTFDLNHSYWQLMMDPETKHKSAFITQNGIYQFKRLAMGLKNSGASFQMAMSHILRGLNWKFLLIYIDDILLFSKGFDQHLEHLEQLFQKLLEANLTMKPSKCTFAAKEVKFLGHIISKHGIAANPAKTSAISTFPVPKTVKQLRSFLGATNFYKSYVPGYSALVAPLHNLLRKDVRFVWTPECQQAFDMLKEKLTTHPVVLAHPDMNKPFSLTTDASQTSIGFYLSQFDDNNQERIVSYGGRALSSAERNWSVSELECLAVIVGIRRFHSYLAYSEFTVFSDHKSLEFLMTKPKLTGRLARWAIELQSYNFKIKHKTGKANRMADFLSRREYPTESADVNVLLDGPSYSETPITKGEPVLVEFSYSNTPELAAIDPEMVNFDMTNLAEIGQLQKECPDFKELFQYIQHGVLPEDEKSRRKIVSTAEYYDICNDTLYHWFLKRTKHVTNEDKWIKQLALPRILRQKALFAYHDSSAHLGIEKVMASLKTKYFWPKMHQDIYDYIHSCDRCQRSKLDQHNRPPPLTSMPIEGAFDRWHIDFLKLSKTTEGYQYVLLVVDSFTRWVEAFPMKTQDSKSVARVLFEQVFSRFGAPKKLVSDLGKQFTSNLIQALCEIFDVQRCVTSAYHPQSNSFCERNNRTLIQALRTYTDKDQDNWPSKIHGVLMALRNSNCSQSTEFSPYFMVFGKEMRLPFDVAIAPKDNLTRHAQDYINEVIANLKISHEIATQNVTEKQAKSKQRYDQSTKVPIYRLNDTVLLRKHQVPLGKSPKLVDKYEGPFYIAGIGPHFTYKLRNCSDHKPIKAMVNACRLRLYHDPIDYREHSVHTQNTGQITPVNSDEVKVSPNDDNTPRVLTPEEKTNRPPLIPADHIYYPIDKILKTKIRDGTRQFYVQWTDNSRSWQPQTNLSDYSIREYFSAHTKTGKARRRKGRPLFYLLVLLCWARGPTLIEATANETQATVIDGIIQRLNYGTIFRADGHILLGTEYWHQTFQIQLPDLPNTYSEKEACGQVQGATCTYIKYMTLQIYTLHHETRRKLVQTLHFIENHVPQATHIPSKTKRALFGFVADWSKSIFGTATIKDVQILSQHIKHLTTRTDKVLDTLEQHGQHMSSYMTTTNERVNLLQSHVKNNFKAI